MKGNEGPSWPWCAGFVSYLLKQVCTSADIARPLAHTFSCDLLAADAREKHRFVSERDVQQGATVAPGSLFLVRRTSTDWVHTGLVTRTMGDAFETIEGNTNDDGDREGYEVCRRIRGFKSKDFVQI
jgi:hypothetical protein